MGGDPLEFFTSWTPYADFWKKTSYALLPGFPARVHLYWNRQQATKITEYVSEQARRQKNQSLSILFLSFFSLSFFLSSNGLASF